LEKKFMHGDVLGSRSFVMQKLLLRSVLKTNLINSY